MSDEADDLSDLSGLPPDGPVDAAVRVGAVTLPADVVLETAIQRYREGPVIRHRATVVLDVTDMDRLPVWNYRDDVAFVVDSEQVFSGFIEQAVFPAAGRLVLQLHDHTRFMQHLRPGTVIGVNLDDAEKLRLILRLSGQALHRIVGVETDDRERPFLFAIPIVEARWSVPTPGPRSYRIDDLVVGCHDEGTMFGLVLFKTQQGQPLAEAYHEWRTDVPRVSGLVYAKDFFDARAAAIRRARVALDVLVAGVRFGQSKIGSAGDVALMPWNFAFTRGRPRLSGWTYLRDMGATKPKALVIEPRPDPLAAPLDLAEAVQRLELVEALLRPVSRATGIRPPDEEALPDEVQVRLDACQRTLHWLANARAETVPSDALIALWFALETLLTTGSYPGFFDGDQNAQVRENVLRFVEQMPLPAGTTIDKKFLTGRLLRGDPPLLNKVQLFAAQNGADLRDDEVKLVGKLNGKRGAIVHGSSRGEPTAEELKGLEHLVEKLFFARLVRFATELPERLYTFADRLLERAPRDAPSP